MSLEILTSIATMSPNYFDGLLADDTKMDDNKPFRCPSSECNREFTSKRNLVDHLRGHHQGQKPHLCAYPGCGKSFLRPAHLQIHYRIHTGEKPFVCSFEGCGKRWNQKSALKQHMRSHTGEKPFVCTMQGCNKSFSTSSSCKRHISTHARSPSEMMPKRKGMPLDSSGSSSSSEDECLDTRPMKKQALTTNALIKMEQVEADELARKMALRFILN